MGFSSVRNSLKAKFDSIKAEFGNIDSVYDYNESKVKGFPAVTIESEKLEGVLGSNVQIENMYTFLIAVHQEYESLGREVASKRLDDLVDVIINEINKDFTLGGTVKQVTPVGATKTQIEDSAEGKKIVFNLIFQVEELSNIYPNC